MARMIQCSSHGGETRLRATGCLRVYREDTPREARPKGAAMLSPEMREDLIGLYLTGVSVRPIACLSGQISANRLTERTPGRQRALGALAGCAADCQVNGLAPEGQRPPPIHRGDMPGRRE